MAMRIIAAAFFGGIAMFLWLSLAHMSPLGEMGISPLPREMLITSTLESGAGGRGGLYMFPASPEASAEVASGFMVFYPDNMFFGSMNNRIILELSKDILQAAILTILIVWSKITAVAPRIGFASAVGLLAAATTNFSLTIWYGFPLAYALGAGTIALLGYVVAGIAIAIILPHKSMASAGASGQ
jgi:hypothetical protein